jgi:pSer/pThr/pTyr-binding forkhead associated (FHA) protein
LQPGQSLPLGREAILGRAADSTVRIDDSFVSAHHARIRRVDGRWYLADLGSTNGTILNDESVDGERQIDYGDLIVIGDIRLKLARS